MPKGKPETNVSTQVEREHGRVVMSARDGATGARMTFTLTRGSAATLGGLLTLASLPDQEQDDYRAALAGELLVAGGAA